AAHRAGIRDIILPLGNERDLRDVPADVRELIRFHFVERMDDVVKLALMLPGTAKAKARAKAKAKPAARAKAKAKAKAEPAAKAKFAKEEKAKTALKKAVKTTAENKPRSRTSEPRAANRKSS
ncbi:MAG TPA: S16 family serine protease, partial [Longimicrobiales bacterium]